MGDKALKELFPQRVTAEKRSRKKISRELNYSS